MAYFNQDSIIRTKPPLIPGSSNFDTNTSNITKTQSLSATIISDGVATLQNGFFTGISNPTNSDDAVPKSYIVGAVPGGVSKNVQYNVSGLFAGSDNLIFEQSNTVGTLSLTGSFSDGVLSINNDYISGITESSNSSSAITRRYCDFIKSRNYITNISTTDKITMTYGPNSIINGTIIRSSTRNNTDTLPTADSICTFLNNQNNYTTSGYLSTTGSLAISGTSYKFCLINNGSYYITIQNNTGLVIKYTTNTSNIAVPPSYILRGTIYINSLSPASVTLYVDSIQLSVVYMSNFFTDTQFTTFLPYYVGNNLLMPVNSDTANTTDNYTYTTSDVRTGLIIRHPVGDSNDGVDNILINTSLTIQNVSNRTITISTSTSVGSWYFYPGNITISPSQSSIIYFSYQGTTNYLNLIGTTTMI